MLVLVLALLSQMAMACPRDAGQQSSGKFQSYKFSPIERRLLKERHHEAPVKELSITHNFCELVGTAHEADSR
jgi:hypothetical protein